MFNFNTSAYWLSSRCLCSFKTSTFSFARFSIDFIWSGVRVTPERYPSPLNFAAIVESHGAEAIASFQTAWLIRAPFCPPSVMPMWFDTSDSIAC